MIWFVIIAILVYFFIVLPFFEMKGYEAGMRNVMENRDSESDNDFYYYSDSFED